MKSDVNFQAHQDNEANAQLELGVGSEVVEVSSGAVAVQTTTSTLHNTLTARMSICRCAGYVEWKPD